MSRALFEITSRGTGPGGANEVFTFSEQTASPVTGHRPLLEAVSHKTGLVAPGAVLFNDEWSVTLSDDGTEGQGTFLGRLLARLPYWRGRQARIYWADADKWMELVIYSVSRERGRAVFTLTTPIREALDRMLSEFDRPAFLASAVTSTSNTFPLTGAVDAPSFIRIGDEIIATIPQANVTTIAIDAGASPARGAAGTTAAAHAAGERVHRVLHYRADAARILERILSEELGLRAFMDTESFREAAAWFRPVVLEKYFTDAEKVVDALRELLEVCGGTLVYDEFDGRIRLVSQAVWERTGVDTMTLDADNLIGDGAEWSSAEQPQEQATRCTVIYGTGAPLGSGENPSVLHVDAEAESDQEYARAIPREIDASAWLNNADRTVAKNSAEIIAERTVQQLRDPPRRIIGLELFGADGRAVRKGDVVRVRLPEFSQSEDGESQVVEALVQSAQRHVLANRSSIRLSAYGRYEADFAPTEIIITNRRFNLSIEELFGLRTAAFDGLIRVVGANAGVFGTREEIPAFKSGSLPAGTTVRIRAEQGAKIGGLSGRASTAVADAGNGGDVFHITSGLVTAERDDHPDSCIAPGGGGGPRGGRGANGTANNGGAGGVGGHGQGWSAALGLWIGDDQFADPGGISSRERMFGQPGSDGLGPTGGDGGLRGALTAPATDGGDAGNAEDGGGGGGGAEGGEFGQIGETAGSGGDSGSVAGASPGTPGAGGKLARVTGGTFSHDEDDPCIIGDVIGPGTTPLDPPVVTVRPNRYQAVWTNEPVIGITPAIVVQTIGASSQTEVLRSTAGAGTLTNTGSVIVNYRARIEFAGRTASAWVYFTLQPQVAAALPDPVVTISADGRRASFTNAVTEAGNVVYWVERRNPENMEFEGYQSYRESAITWTITADGQDDQTYRIRALTIGPPTRTSSAWVVFNVKAPFYGTLSVSSNASVVTAGESVDLEFWVSEQPSADVPVTISVANTAIATAGETSFTVTSANWENRKEIAFTGVAAGMTTFTATAGGTSEYAGQTVTGSISVSGSTRLNVPASAELSPGVAVSLPVSLGAQPTGDVLLTLSTEADGVTIATAQITVPFASWQTAVNFSATLDEDSTLDNVTFTVTAQSGGYNGVTANFVADVANPFEISAPDSVLIPVGPTGLPNLTGNANRINIKLSAQPDAAVRLLVRPVSRITFSNTYSQRLVFDADLTGGTNLYESYILDYTTQNWNTNQSLDLRQIGATWGEGEVLGWVYIEVIGMPRINKVFPVSIDSR